MAARNLTRLAIQTKHQELLQRQSHRRHRSCLRREQPANMLAMELRRVPIGKEGTLLCKP